jgi:hypothetical protein
MIELVSPDIIIRLSEIAASDFSEASSIAERTISFTDDFNKGKTTAAEFHDLLEDLNVEKLVATIASEFQIKMALSALINDLLAIAVGAGGAALKI